MHISFIALGSHGDVQPYALLGKSLVAAGHRVSFITTENYTPLLDAYGLEPEPLPGDAERVVRDAGATWRPYPKRSAVLQLELSIALSGSSRPSLKRPSSSTNCRWAPTGLTSLRNSAILCGWQQRYRWSPPLHSP